MIVVLLTFVVLATTVLSCISDARTLRIPNLHSLIVLGAFVPAYFLSPESFGPWWEPLGALAIFFVITYVMFSWGMMGGGDAKLGSALALWTGLKGFLPYVFYMALTGGVLGIIALTFKKYKFFKNPAAGSWVASAQEGRNAVPYGIAISVGAWAGLLHTGLIHHQLDEVIKIIH